MAMGILLTRRTPKQARRLGALHIVLLLLLYVMPAWAGGALGHFEPGHDLFLPQFDSKTDVDDLHSVAAVATVLRDPRFADVRFHAVAGAYGIQDGLYVPSPDLFRLAFGGNWSDAHEQRQVALETVAGRVAETLENGGDVWVAEAGQSDFTADWLEMIRGDYPEIDTRQRIHVVQHSDWNESVTAPEKLAYVKEHADYIKIPDGNAGGNGSPGFRTDDGALWAAFLQDPGAGDTWREARDKANLFNGSEERYLNTAIAAGGMDFSDTAETCWIFGLAGLADAAAFFEEFVPAE